MKLNMYDAFDLIAEDAVELLAEYDRISERVRKYSAQEVIQTVLGSNDGRISSDAGYLPGTNEPCLVRNEKILKKRLRKINWKIRLLAAVLIVAVLSSVSFAFRQRNVRHGYGAELINDTNRDLVGKALTIEVPKIYDSEGNFVNEEEWLDFYGAPDPNLFDWTTSSMIRKVDSDAHVPATIDEFTVQEDNGKFITPEVIFPNNAMVIFTKKDGSGWHLNKGETLWFEVEEYPSEINWEKGQCVHFQYIFNGTLMDGEVIRGTLNLVYELTADKSGEYYICMVGGSSDPISLKEGKLVIKP